MGWAGGRGGCLSCYSKPGWGVLGCNTVLVKYIVTIVGVALKMGTCTFHVRCSGAMLKMRMTVLSWHSPGIASHPHHIAYILQIWKQHLKQCFEKYRLELWRECFFHDDTTKWTPACHMISDSLNVLQVLQVRRKSFVYLVTPKTLLKTTSQAHRSSPPRPEERWAVHMWIHPAQGQLHVWLACWPEFLAWPETHTSKWVPGFKNFLMDTGLCLQIFPDTDSKESFSESRGDWLVHLQYTLLAACHMDTRNEIWDIKFPQTVFLFTWNQTSWSLHFRGWRKRRKPIYMIQYVNVYMTCHSIACHAMPCNIIPCQKHRRQHSYKTQHAEHAQHT